MADTPDNETWLIDAGDAVITKRASGSQLSSVERLIYCVWVADYGMRNAGDLETADDLHPEFQSEAVGLAEELGLPFTRDSFTLPTLDLQGRYFERFDRVCCEIRGA